MKKNLQQWSGKRLVLACMLALCCIALSACYMEPDRIVDTGTDLNTGGTQNFDTILTPTPVVTPTPTPAPTSNAIDWSNWNFGPETATTPPGGAVPTMGPVDVDTSPTQPPLISATVGTVSTATPRPTTGGTSTGASTTLKVGSEGTDVKRLQQRLKDLGYLSGSVDGKFGAGTELAVKDFQYVNGLSVDGKAGTRTQQVLYSKNAKARPSNYVSPYSISTGGTGGSSSGSSSSGGSSGGSSAGSSGGSTSAYTEGKTNIYLRLGDQGSNVKYMQNRLIVLGYLTGTADGVFAETTEAAVIAFQKRHSIYADGVAGPDTLTKMYSSSAKRASGVAGTLGSLREGMNGDAVRALQKNLKTLGYYTGTVDGDYGSGTMTAVMAFQSANGLTPDGIAGKATLNAIQSALSGGAVSGGSSGSASANSPERYGTTASSTGYTTISPSSNSANVTTLQATLRAHGFYNGSVDGDFGSGTATAVEDYQRAKGLRVTGMAGPATQRMLFGGSEETGSYSKLQLGSSGSSVKRLQYALYELKYYDGDITGKFDAATESAVMTFQEVNGLYIDGVAGQDTQRRLFSSYALPCDL